MEDTEERIFRGVGIVSFFILLSRITGLLRETALAFFLGASYITDALFVGWAIPNTLRRFFADGLVAPAFIPAFSKAKQEGKIKEAFSSILVYLSLITMSLSVLIALLSPFIPSVLAPGFSYEGKKLSSFFLVIFSPYIFLISLATLFSALLNSFYIFGIPASTMVVFNIFCIAGTFAGGTLFERAELGFAVGVFAGVIIQTLMQIPQVSKLTSLSISFGKNEFSAIMLRAIPPIVAGGAIYQLNFLVSRAIASLGGEKVVSYLTYASRFFELPLGLFVYSISYVSLPFLAEGGKKGKNSFQYAIALTTAITLPASIGLCILSEPIIYFVFGYGKFNYESVSETAKALFMYSLGLLPVGLSRILVTDFQAVGKLKIPVIASAISFVSNALFSLALVYNLKHQGIALASSISAFVSFIYLTAKTDKFRKFVSGLLEGSIVALFPSLLCVITSILYMRFYESFRMSNRIYGFTLLLLTIAFVFLSFLISLRIYVKKVRLEHGSSSENTG